jgi:hypothetical protein
MSESGSYQRLRGWLTCVCLGRGSDLLCGALVAFGGPSQDAQDGLCLDRGEASSFVAVCDMNVVDDLCRLRHGSKAATVALKRRAPGRGKSRSHPEADSQQVLPLRTDGSSYGHAGLRCARTCCAGVDLRGVRQAQRCDRLQRQPWPRVSCPFSAGGTSARDCGRSVESSAVPEPDDCAQPPLACRDTAFHASQVASRSA